MILGATSFGGSARAVGAGRCGAAVALVGGTFRARTYTVLTQTWAAGPSRSTEVLRQHIDLARR